MKMSFAEESGSSSSLLTGAATAPVVSDLNLGNRTLNMAAATLIDDNTYANGNVHVRAPHSDNCDRNHPDVEPGSAPPSPR